ncbi:MAG: 4Fe-4S binding protein [Chloroflexi bacterium]|nr:4Fe-4S binding protein [Chloroflexota bacterium]
MTTRVTRKIVRIDEEKCDGCGLCVPSCAEGALRIVDGKAKLVSERYCDGLGACLGECPQGAITIEERAAQEFSEAAVEQHLHGRPSREEESLPCGCPSASVAEFGRPAGERAPGVSAPSMLRHWPVQLALVPPGAPFLKGADILLAAHCVPFAHADFHRDLLKDHALLIACPKLDDLPAHLRKLTRIIEEAAPSSLTVVHMEVPCCSGLVYLARQAIAASGRDVPLNEITIGVRGGVLAEA